MLLLIVVVAIKKNDQVCYRVGIATSTVLEYSNKQKNGTSEFGKTERPSSEERNVRVSVSKMIITLSN